MSAVTGKYIHHSAEILTYLIDIIGKIASNQPTNDNPLMTTH